MAEEEDGRPVLTSHCSLLPKFLLSCSNEQRSPRNFSLLKHGSFSFSNFSINNFFVNESFPVSNGQKSAIFLSREEACLL
uniref:Uncharacterized protein n=1 Tax=Nelumbo nucifera TaxID=4432 RepID=A0A822ZHB8_NELNU|nr:TPA_asm: hypothetical protein HUJ06_015400 [Nelumbo nucifera]DAD41078.1 TPA_asm: hypothetical protein HUJ06_015401 [Nelumbo nucifera]